LIVDLVVRQREGYPLPFLISISTHR